MAGCFIEKSSVVKEFTVECPYCGEMINSLVDESAGEQEYYEDCAVCCCPILFVLSIDELNNIKLVVKRDDE